MSTKYLKDYQFSKEVDESTLKKAKKELNEKDSKQVATDIEYIKQWLSKQPSINSRMDDAFILSFLRYSKFSYSRAQEALTNFWTNRVEMKDTFSNRSFADDSIILELADVGAFSWLPQTDDEGCRVAINRIALWDPKKYEFDDFVKTNACYLDVICEDPRVQVNGVVLIMDMEGMGPAQASEMTPSRAQRMMKLMTHTYPIRIKAIHYIKQPKLFDVVFPIIKQFMSEKIKKRINLHGNEIKSLHKHVPKRILPKEYGGELDSISVINDNWVQYLKSNEKLLMDYQTYGISLDKTKDKGKNVVSASDATDTISGTFRKLNVD